MARGGRVSAGPASRGVVCPECAHVVSSADSAARGTFFRDPRRWLPALVVVLMVLGQVGSITWESSRGASGGDVDFWLPDPTLQFADLRRAVTGDAEQTRRVQEIVDWFLEWSYLGDPAGVLVVEGATLERSLWAPAGVDVAPSFEPRSIGWPFAFLGVQEYPLPAAIDGLLDWSMDAVGGKVLLPPSPGGTHPTSIWWQWRTLAVDVVAMILLAWLLILIARPIREGAGSKRAARWRRASAILFSVITLGTIGVLAPGSNFPFWSPGAISFSIGPGTATTTRTLAEVRALFQKHECVAEFAKLVLAHADSVPLPDTSAPMLRFQAVTSNSKIDWRAGWPNTFLWATTCSNSEPVGVAPVRGQSSVSLSDDELSVRLNHGAWPGTSVLVWGTISAVIYDGLMVFVSWYCAKRLICATKAYHSRRRFARGLCVKCGYDLSGLKARA